MTVAKPYHRNYRGIKPGHNSGYSGWAYINDRRYARNPEHYVRAFTLIQDDLKNIFEYVEPSDEGGAAYSYRIHALLMRTCIEVEANFKAILAENSFNSVSSRDWKMAHYRRVDVTHHLSSYEVMLPIWRGDSGMFKPFEQWGPVRGTAAYMGLPWYQAYNASKHDRQENFKKACLENLVTAVAGLLVLITSQFGSETFDAGPTLLSLSTGAEYHPMKPATGHLFRIRYPDDWADEELYDFDWSTLSKESDRFGKIDYDTIPS